MYKFEDMGLEMQEARSLKPEIREGCQQSAISYAQKRNIHLIVSSYLPDSRWLIAKHQEANHKKQIKFK